jgi:plasmid replication initiation protein
VAEKQVALNGEVVKMTNALARAQWTPESIWEPRIVALVASKIRADDEDFFTYKIPVAELTGVSDENLRGNQYQEIARSIGQLGKAVVRIQGSKPRNFRQYNVFAMCGYEDGYLIANFHPDLKPHFLHLKEQFTAYKLFEYLSLPSTYSQRLFEILKSWSDQPEATIALSELHEMLRVPDSFKKDFAAFRRRVLEKAHKDISEKTTLRYAWEPIKEGKAVTSIRFVFSRGEIAKLEKVKKQPEYKPALDCWQAKKRAKEQCPIRQRGTGGKGKCKICLERLTVEQFGV